MFATDADTAQFLFALAAVLAGVAAVFCLTKRAFESALGWAAVGIGLAAAWLLL